MPSIRGKFSVKLYDCSVNVIISDKIEDVINRQLKKDGEDPIGFSVEGYVYRPSESIQIYYFFLDFNSLSANSINHEKSHLIDYILQDRSIPAKNEQRSYLDGYVSEKLDSFFKKRKIAF